jgi:hypothetical protein
MKRIAALLLIFVLLVSLFAGCAPQTENPTEGTPETGNSSVPGTSEDSTTGSTEGSTDVTLPDAADLVINEVMPDNKKVVLGHENDWIELHNRGDVEVSLDNYYLTDDPTKPNEMSLTGLTIPADGYLVVALDDNAPFRLSADGETVYLTYGGQAISQLTFGIPEDGEAFDTNGVCQYPTPGQPNTAAGYQAYLQALKLPELIINEVMSSNSTFLPVGGECYDLIEIKNNSSAAIDLSKYTLTDKHSEPARFAFPAVTLQPGEYYIVYCSGNTKLGQNHTSFKLSADGETVYLAKDGAFIDALAVPADLAKNASYGRVGNIPQYLEKPTFGGENAKGYAAALSAPVASTASGIYSDAITLTLTGEGDIYYTLDGTCPTEKSTKYTGPITITGVTTVRTFCTSGNRTSPLTAYTYLVGVSHTLPVVSIAIPQDDLNGDAGILNHIDQNYEYEAMLTLIENGEEKFSVPFGFRLHGNDSRKHKKQNFQLRFRSEYGVGKLNYKLFDDLDITEFNSLLLKGGSELWASNMIVDEIATGMVHGTTEVYTQARKPVVLYLGGQFWGVYFFRERFSDDYVASHLGVSAESVDLVEYTDAYTQAGSNADFKALLNYVKSHDMNQSEHYHYLASQIDITSLMDWYICRAFVGDIDLDNIRRFRSSEGDQKWHWVYFDLDWAMYRPEEKAFTKLLSNRCGDPVLINALLQSPQGQDLFIKRCNELFDTVLSEEHFLQVLDQLTAQIHSEIPADRERWGRSVSKWEAEIQKIRDFVKDGKRIHILKENLKEHFGLSDNKMTQYFG